MNNVNLIRESMFEMVFNTVNQITMYMVKYVMKIIYHWD